MAYFSFLIRPGGAGLLVGLLLLWLAVASEAVPLRQLPTGERWYTIRMQDDLVGFVRLAIAAEADGYVITADSSARMLVLGFSREATSRERYLVARDGVLKSFEVEQTIDRSAMHLSGTVTPAGVETTVTAGGQRTQQLLAAKGAVYPPALLNIYPLLKGVSPGKVYRLQILDPEALQVKSVKVTAIGPATVSGEAAYHFRNDLYPVVDNDVWVDLAGNTLRESVRQGLIETAAEPADKVRQLLLTAAVAKRDLVLDFSLVRLAKPIERPVELTRLVIDLTGFPVDAPLPAGLGQAAQRMAPDRVRIVREAAAGQALPPPAAHLLQATPRIPADNADIGRQVRELLGSETNPRRQVEKLASWVAAYVADAVTDGQSALDTLRSRSGNCVSHARLFVAMARAAGLPSRMVGGLVYAPGKGLLYHAWAEVYAGTWLVVDPTFDQVPADLTHIKLAEGESPSDFTGIAGLIGSIRAEVVETAYGSSR